MASNGSFYQVTLHPRRQGSSRHLQTSFCNLVIISVDGIFNVVILFLSSSTRDLHIQIQLQLLHHGCLSVVMSVTAAHASILCLSVCYLSCLSFTHSSTKTRVCLVFSSLFPFFSLNRNHFKQTSLTTEMNKTIVALLLLTILSAGTDARTGRLRTLSGRRRGRRHGMLRRRGSNLGRDAGERLRQPRSWGAMLPLGPGSATCAALLLAPTP